MDEIQDLDCRINASSKIISTLRAVLSLVRKKKWESICCVFTTIINHPKTLHHLLMLNDVNVNDNMQMIHRVRVCIYYTSWSLMRRFSIQVKYKASEFSFQHRICNAMHNFSCTNSFYRCLRCIWYAMFAVARSQRLGCNNFYYFCLNTCKIQQDKNHK